MMLHDGMTLHETLRRLEEVECLPRRRSRFVSPCYFVRIVDVLIHIVAPIRV